MEKIDLSIIIISFNTENILLACLDSIIKNTKRISYEIIVVDNASTDGSVDAIRKYKKKTNLRLITNKDNLGFGKANNQGIKESKAKYILLLNSDCLVQKKAIEDTLYWMDKHPSVGVASCALVNHDGSLQGTGGYFPTLIRVFSWMTIQDLPFVDKFIKPFHPMKSKSYHTGDNFYRTEKELDWVTGAFFLMRKSIVKEVGYFDRDYFMYMEEVDYCFRIKNKGWKIYYLPTPSVIHLGGASGVSGENIVQEYQGVKLFYEKHYPSWQYPLLRILLKVGAFLRIFLFGLLEGKSSAKVYAKAFAKA
jgi:GT2 family glycosyltransferase